MVQVELNVSPKLLVCCVYLPPACSDYVFDALVNSLRALPSDMDILLLGDFNMPDVDWSSLSGLSHRSSELFFDLNLMQLISEPTHVCGGILDLVLLN